MGTFLIFEILRRIHLLYEDISAEFVDRGGKNYPLLSSPWLLLTAVTSYIYFSKSLGPRIMKDREPFQLRSVMVFYNLFQIVVSAWLFVQGLIYGWPGRNKFFCEPIPSLNDDPVDLHENNLLWFCYIFKMIDFLDTVFFVLRKKTKQVSFLHLYHHTSTAVGAYLQAKYFTGGHLLMLGQVNMFVHVVMYTYYLLSSIGASNKYLWWKKYITQLQIAQFLFLLLHTLPTFAMKDCDYPLFLRVLSIEQYAFMLFMFVEFYRATYISRKED